MVAPFFTLAVAAQAVPGPRAFARGAQANGVEMALRVGLPPGMVYHAGATLIVTRRSLTECDTRRRRWYDEKAGGKFRN
jgi:hypothetical protein